MSLKLCVTLCIVYASIVNCHDQIREGTSLTGTSIQALLRNSYSRSVVVSLENHLDVPLTNTKMFLKWGHSSIPPPSTVRPRIHEAMLFNKASHAGSGVTGIVAYEIEDPNAPLRFAFVFSVPFSYAFYNNWFGITTVSQRQPIDEDFYEYLWSHHAWKSHSSTTKFGYAKKHDTLRLTQGPYEITATMSNQGQSQVNIVVRRIKT